MRNFIQYHNAGKLGWVPLDARPFLQTRLAIYTRRRLVEKAVGATVYLIVSLGRPKRYYLWEHFRIDKVLLEADGYCAWGEGRQLSPPARLEGEGFEEFRRACAWFIGFRCIDDLPFLATLGGLARANAETDGHEGVEPFCDELIGLLSGTGDAYFYRGFVRQRSGKNAAAVADLEKALRSGTEYTAAAEESLRLAREAIGE